MALTAIGLQIQPVRDAIQAWAVAVLAGLSSPSQRVTWQFGMGDIPAKPYVSLNLIGPVQVGQAEERQGAYDQAGHSTDQVYSVDTFTVSVNCIDDPTHGGQFMQIAQNLKASLSLPQYYEPLLAAGISVLEVMGVQDLSDMLETKPERRAQFDFRIEAGSAAATDLGQISTVHITPPSLEV